MRIQAHQLTWVADGREIISDIDLDCPGGQVTGLLGPNGSGKTTLLHALAGLRRPTRGQVLVGGQVLHTMRAKERARLLAMVEQHAGTGLDLTVRQVVELGLIPHRGRWSGDRRADRQRVDAALHATRVAHLADRSWQVLSGGERQRTHLARAIAQRPGVLLLDEPTNHLDIAHQLDFLRRVRDLRVTTVAALHDLELAAAHCDRLVVLDAGRVVAAGPVTEVLTSRLIAEVYDVEAVVEPHPTRDRMHVRLDGLVDRSRRAEETR